MKTNKALKLCALALALYLVIGVAFYFIAGDSLFATSDTTAGITGSDTTGEIIVGDEIRQSFYCDYDTLDCLVVKVTTGARQNNSTLAVQILDADGQVVRTTAVNTSAMEDWEQYDILLDPIKDAKGKKFTMVITTPDGAYGNTVALFYGNTVDAGRGSVQTEITEELALYVNGETPIKGGKLCSLALDVRGSKTHMFGTYYWYFYAGGALLFGAFLALLYIRYRKGKKPHTAMVVKSLYKYNFLIRQLVSRDFKTKYKRSVLGMLWSFLNPLLTMSIQYVVFSTIFSSNIENFVVYLLTGIICYNFFSEATNMCLMSIVGNASLISKVYVPKYIYPFSRSLSSCINLLLSLIPLLACLLITGNRITPAILLMPFGLLMLFMLSYGVGLILATLMVFFRDTQFLWNIATMLLMYLTPIFYPETIIPAQFMTVYKLNPLYHILRFMRSILIDGVSLEPKAYLICAALCIIPFVIGVIVFRKNEDKFVLNI